MSHAEGDGDGSESWACECVINAKKLLLTERKRKER